MSEQELDKNARRFLQAMMGEATNSQPDLTSISKWQAQEAVKYLQGMLAEIERLHERLRYTIAEREANIQHATLAAKERYEAAEAENAALREMLAEGVEVIVPETGFAGADWEIRARALLGEKETVHGE